MDTGSIETFTVIKPMGIEPLHARIEMQLRAAIFRSERFQPAYECRTMPGRSGSGKSDEIVDVSESAPREIFEDPESCDGDDSAACLPEHDSITTVPFLEPYAIDEVFFGKMGPKFAHDRETGSDFFVGRCDADIVDHRANSFSDIEDSLNEPVQNAIRTASGQSEIKRAILVGLSNAIS
jgi:hypothetical protein